MVHFDNPHVPLAINVHDGIPHEAEIEVHGETVEGHSKSFCVEFVTHHHDHHDIAFHLDAKFGHEHAFVLNNKHEGKWQQEHHIHEHHLEPNQHFTLKIKNHGEHLAIEVNGHSIVGDFHHRASLHDVREIVIRGDVKVEKLHLEHFKHGHELEVHHYEHHDDHHAEGHHHH
ncbi:galectin protein 10 [Aphelenchoides avenae]|nr:galectin protein 10 [Aphelenchus avenae]